MTSTAYSNVRLGKLKLKGSAGGSSTSREQDRKRKRKSAVVVDNDAVKHGGWWLTTEFEQISGPVAIEVFPFTYIKALDDGTFTFGSAHEEGESPNPEEILTAVRVSDSKIALKSGYGKYLSVTASGKVTGKAEAIGALEQFEPVFEEGKLALCGSNQCFLTCKNDDELTATSVKVGMDEVLKVRSNAERSVKRSVEEQEGDNVKETELHYVKMFQCFQDKKIKINPGAAANLEEAKKEGKFHETLLDRREKMKSDRMCK